MPAEETRGFFHKTFKNLTKLLSGGYRKLSKPLPLRPFSCGSCRKHGTKVANRMDRLHCGEWRCDYKPGSARAESSEELYKEEKAVERKAAGSSENARTKKQGSGRSEKRRSEGEFELARRMKELERMDGGDVEQVLDVEEALHYYSRLKSPVYMEIVDRFFMDMYDDFSTPPRPPQLQQHPPALSKCGTGSRRRLGSIRS